jgi:predicted  nucleic acid-binding Zn-ribbon protein
MNDEHDNFGVSTEEMNDMAQAVTHANRRADAAEIEVEKLTKDIGKLKAEAAGCWEIRKALQAELAETDKALRDALTLVVYLASKIDD